MPGFFVLGAGRLVQAAESKLYTFIGSKIASHETVRFRILGGSDGSLGRFHFTLN